MRIAIGTTNPNIWHNLDVFLDGKLLDPEHFGIMEADDVKGYVVYLALERDANGRQDFTLDHTPDGNLRRRRVKANGVVEFRDRAFLHPGAENCL